VIAPRRNKIATKISPTPRAIKAAPCGLRYENLILERNKT